ncbi:MAG: UDP-2,3-diacylglucosamine diphosphatase, partial [Pedobacter sp.]
MTKNLYFASDFHLGSPNHEASRSREDRIIRWLDAIEPTCGSLFLVGDVFDFWYEYKMVIPKGFIRLQGKLATMSDAGIKIYFFKGNHDMWVDDYFTTEMGIQIVSDELVVDHDGKKFYIHHGDGLGPGDYK